jgi:hypothetical protein
MSTPLEIQPVIQPELPDVLLNLKQDIFATLNCHMPGIIQSFDADACTAIVQPVFKRMLTNGNVVERPVIVDCPVIFPGGGGGRLTFPVTAGDQCLIFYADRRLDEWSVSGNQELPGDPRMHDLSDGIVLVGLDPTGAFGTVPTNMVVLSYQGSQFQITSTGWKFIGEGGAELDLTGDTVALKNGNAEIDLITSIVTIKNATTTLLTVMNQLLTAIEGIQVTGPLPLTPASVTALEVVRTQLATLLG